MSTHNTEIATAFSEIVDMLEIESANPFRIRAYRNAVRLSRTLDNTPRTVRSLQATRHPLHAQEIWSTLPFLPVTTSWSSSDSIKAKTVPHAEMTSESQAKHDYDKYMSRRSFASSRMMFAIFIHKTRSFTRRPRFEQVWFIPAWLLLGVSRLLILVVSFRSLAPHLGRHAGSAPWLPLLDARRAITARSRLRRLRGTDILSVDHTETINRGTHMPERRRPRLR
ncbi:MAG TPA: helix-hairpin-helix domain-containing protein [Gallionella sp.]|nr:helix-hairpin-helix domain-containing protein [Gallionella sp.]